METHPTILLNTNESALRGINEIAELAQQAAQTAQPDNQRIVTSETHGNDAETLFKANIGGNGNSLHVEVTDSRLTGDSSWRDHINGQRGDIPPFELNVFPSLDDPDTRVVSMVMYSPGKKGFVGLNGHIENDVITWDSVEEQDRPASAGQLNGDSAKMWGAEHRFNLTRETGHSYYIDRIGAMANLAISDAADALRQR